MSFTTTIRIFAGGCFAAVALPQPPSTTCSQQLLSCYKPFPSRYVIPREVDVRVPASYAKERSRRYPVIYMQDGQNVFDPANAFGHQSWEVDKAIDRLGDQNKITAPIIVAVWNSAHRFAEYMPQKAAEGKDLASDRLNLNGEAIVSDRYLQFLVDELKPFIDTHYRTLRAREDTFVMGSSMGGLISLYAVMQHPLVFGGAACLSTHWPAVGGAMVDYSRTHLPDPKTHRLYFDFGTKTLDAQYESYQRKVDEFGRQRGYVEGKTWLTMKFPGAEHTESAWRSRLSHPLVFLLGSAGGGNDDVN